MIMMQKKADFSSWPISKSLKALLLKQEKWIDYFSVSPSTFYEEIKQIANSL